MIYTKNAAKNHTKGDPRYQYQKWYVKLWRLRWKLTVPYYAVRAYILEQFFPDQDMIDATHAAGANYEPLGFLDCWSVAQGMADLHMKHYYTGAELGLNNKLRDLIVPLDVPSASMDIDPDKLKSLN